MKNVKAYWKPATVQEAVALLQQHPRKAVCIAGGTHIAAAKDPAIEYLVDLTFCGLAGISQQNEYIEIGACTTLEELQASELIRSIASGILAEAAQWTGSAQRRNAATVGGSLMLRRDLVLPLLALDARVVIVGSAERGCSLTALYADAGPALEPDEIITACRIPAVGLNATGAVQRQSRTRQDVTIAAVAAVTEVANQQCTHAAIAVMPVQSGISRVPAAEQHLQGQSITADRIAQAVDALKSAISPLADYHASADYRRKVLGVYTQRALMQCFHVS